VIGYRCLSCGWVTELIDEDRIEDIGECERCKKGPITLLTTAGMEDAIVTREIVHCPACRAYHSGAFAPTRRLT
jgi:hypothetical protein